MALSKPGLTPLQRDFVEAFFSTTQAFYLTGGGALVGFHGLHRHTDDLDLFTSDPLAFENAAGLLGSACDAMGSQIQVLATYPTFRRFGVQRGTESMVVDFVYETVPPLHDKGKVGEIVIDSPPEILANKITTLVSRSEVRDLWDTYQLIRSGLSFEQALREAARKDAGVDAASLVFVLSQIDWEAAGRLAATSDLGDWDEVASYFRELCKRLAIQIAPSK